MNEYTLNAFEVEPTRPSVVKIKSNAHQPERNEALRLIQADRMMVYAMRLPTGLVKIGCSSDLVERRQQMRGEILGFTVGNFATERELHRSLRASVHHGREYYNPTPEVLAVVNEMRDGYNLPHLAA